MESDTEATCRERALAWAGAGWPVFPCLAYDGHDARNPSKQKKAPFIEAWQKQATTDPAQIEAWWNEWPEAIPAAVPGLVGCFALDVDVKGDGEASLIELENLHGFEAWEIPQQPTPSGGRHLIFRGYAPTTRGVLGRGLDTRGGRADGESGLGYVCCYAADAPSDPQSCPPGPDSLSAACGRRKERADDAETPLVEWDDPANVRRAGAYLGSAVPAAEGGRNDALFRAATAVKDLGVSRDKLIELLGDHPAALGSPPLGEDEAYATINSAYANGQLAPGTFAVNPATVSALVAQLAAADPPAPGGVAARASPRRVALWSERRARPAPPWIIRHVIPAGSLVGLFGPGGSYKSFLALDMALRVAAGKPEWAGQAILKPGPVVYVSGEGSLEPRVRAWEQTHGPVPDTFALLDGLALTDPDDLLALAKDIDELTLEHWHTPPVMVWIDTMARAAVGLDENSAKDMGQVVAAANEVQRRYGCAVPLVHHTPAADKGKWRGSNAVYNALDTAIAVERTDEGRATLRLERQKDSLIGRAWYATLAVVETGLERDGEPEASLAVTTLRGAQEGRGGDRKGSAAKVRVMSLLEARVAACRKVLAGLPNGGTTGAAVLAKMAASALGPGANEEGIRSWLRTAARRGKIDGSHGMARFIANANPVEFRFVPEATMEGE